MPVVEVRRDTDGIPYRIILNHLGLWGVERGIWERWPVRKATELDLSAWVDRHAGPGSQLELLGEGAP